MRNAQPDRILILGIGCILFSDEGFGVRVIERLREQYDFPENVSLVDGGVLGLNLLSVISEADVLIVVDAVRNKGKPGDLHRLEGEEVPNRIRAKNSLHQVDFLETLAACRLLDKVPETVIFGVEPEDIETLSLDLTPATRAKVDQVIGMVIEEVQLRGASYQKRSL